MLSCRLAAVLILSTVMTGPTASAVLIDHLPLVYSEDFEGETFFPTSPELDSLGLGGLFDLALGNGAPAISFDGSNLDVGLNAAAGPFFFEELIVVGVSSFGPTETLGARTVLSGYSAVVNGVGQTFAGLVLGGPGGLLTANLQRFVSSLAPQDDLLGIVVSEIDDALTGTTTTFDFVLFDAPTRAAVEAGQAVTLELLFDRSTGLASAVATVGASQFATGSISPTLVGGDVINGFGVFAGVTNVFRNSQLGDFDLGRDDSLNVSFQSYELAALPEPAAGGLIGLGLALLGMRKGLRSRLLG